MYKSIKGSLLSPGFIFFFLKHNMKKIINEKHSKDLGGGEGMGIVKWDSSSGFVKTKSSGELVHKSVFNVVQVHT